MDMDIMNPPIPTARTATPGTLYPIEYIPNPMKAKAAKRKKDLRAFDTVFLISTDY